MLIYSMCVFGDGGNMDRKSNLGFFFFNEKDTCKHVHEKWMGVS